MTNRLTDFLIDLGENPARLATFQRRPAEEMKRAGLSAREQLAIASGNDLRIRKALNPEDEPFKPIWVDIGVANVRQAAPAA